MIAPPRSAEGTTPVVGVICDRRYDCEVPYDVVRSRYCEALRRTAGLLPLLLPLDMEPNDLPTVLDRLDGLVLTGAESNVAPHLYGESHGDAAMLLDPERDRVAMVAIGCALARRLPILGICRGIQELNVALGGALDAHLSTKPGGFTHWEDVALPRDLQYGPAHSVTLTPGGVLELLLGTRQLAVSSLHRQGISRLAKGLAVEALAPDGLVEAVSVANYPGFALAVQWHIEWFHSAPESAAIWQAFAAACYRNGRRANRTPVQSGTERGATRGFPVRAI